MIGVYNLSAVKRGERLGSTEYGQLPDRALLLEDVRRGNVGWRGD